MIAELLAVLNQSRVFHWQTKSHAEHVALGGLYDKLDDLVDSFVETYSGAYGSVEQAAAPGFQTIVYNYQSNADLLAFCDFTIKYLTEDLSKQVRPECTDLLNIIADMIGALNHAKYLLRQS
jgi:hypothetical protein